MAEVSRHGSRGVRGTGWGAQCRAESNMTSSGSLVLSRWSSPGNEPYHHPLARLFGYIITTEAVI